MNKKILEGNWDQLKGNIQNKWGELTDNDLESIKGDITILAGKIKGKYGMKQEEIEGQIKEYLDELKDKF